MCNKCSKTRSSGINGAIVTKRKGRKAEVDVPELVKAAAGTAVGFFASNFVTTQVTNVLPSAAGFTGIVKVAAGAATAYLASQSGSASSRDIIVPVAVGMATSGVIDLARQFLPATLQSTLGINKPVFIGPTRTRAAIAPARGTTVPRNPVSTGRVLVNTAA